MKYIVGFSGGIDSQAAARWTLNRYPKEDVILLNSNAGGNEHPLTVAFVEQYSRDVHPVIVVPAILQDMWETENFESKNERIREVVADSKMTDELTFLKMIQIKGRSPSRKAQFCTEILKLRPQRRWVRANVTVEYCRITGVRRDESSARTNYQAEAHDDYFDCRVLHPCVDWTKQMAFDFVQAHAEEINPLYKLGFGRVGCAPCINSGKDDILRWSQRFPEMIDKIREWERVTGRTFFAPCVPGKHTNTIDEVVAWAGTSRGGVQLNILHTPPSCESKFGLCE